MGSILWRLDLWAKNYDFLKLFLNKKIRKFTFTFILDQWCELKNWKIKFTFILDQ